MFGIGVSNTLGCGGCCGEGIRVTACDKRSRDALGALAEELEKAGCRLRLGESYLQGLNQDVIFRTRGLRPDVPELLAAKARGSDITSEMEVFFEVCPCLHPGRDRVRRKDHHHDHHCRAFGAAGKTVHVGGNIGNPLLAGQRYHPEDYAVLELSSFQLMTMTHSPHIAVVTNLAPNHLDMHKSMEEYVGPRRTSFAINPPGIWPFLIWTMPSPAAGPCAPRAVPCISAAGRSRKRRISAGRGNHQPP